MRYAPLAATDARAAPVSSSAGVSCREAKYVAKPPLAKVGDAALADPKSLRRHHRQVLARPPIVLLDPRHVGHLPAVVVHRGASALDAGPPATLELNFYRPRWVVPKLVDQTGGPEHTSVDSQGVADAPVDSPNGRHSVMKSLLGNCAWSR